MTRPLTEAAAWTQIARNYTLPATHQDRPTHGLCSEIHDLAFFDRICENTYRAMIGRLRDYVDEGTYAYPWLGTMDSADDYYTTYQEARCLAALWLAHEARAKG